MSPLINMKIRSVIAGSGIGVMLGLLFFMEVTTLMGIDISTDNSCADLDCVKERVIRCILEAVGEYEIRECI